MNNIFTSFKVWSVGGIIVLIIGALSVIAIAVIIERYVYYSKLSKRIEDLFIKIKGLLLDKSYEDLLTLLENNITLPISKILYTGIQQAPYVEEHELRQIIEDEGIRQSYYMKKRLFLLSTIATISPLLGLLGTVTGMIQSFYIIGNAGANPGNLASGIAGALLTTAAGLLVAIPAIIFYNILVNKNKLMVIGLEERVGQLFKYIKGIPETGKE
ncbi:MotA/TolQ/ExbB proton channel family protein [bacterium]|nr:MotA/TolQ/ExbB proton channel family protein [bacterium]